MLFRLGALSDFFEHSVSKYTCSQSEVMGVSMGGIKSSDWVMGIFILVFSNISISCHNSLKECFRKLLSVGQYLAERQLFQYVEYKGSEKSEYYWENCL